MLYIYIEELDNFIEIKNDNHDLYLNYLIYSVEKYYQDYNENNINDNIKYFQNHINNQKKDNIKYFQNQTYYQRKNNKRKRIN